MSVWIAGGWVWDALLGRQTRRHYDLDLVISDSDEEYRKVADVLQREGFHPDEPERPPGWPCHCGAPGTTTMGTALRSCRWRWQGLRPCGACLRADTSRLVAVHISLRPDQGPDGALPVSQTAGHAPRGHGYPLRDIDETDLGLLQAYVHGAERTMPRKGTPALYLGSLPGPYQVITGTSP